MKGKRERIPKKQAKKPPKNKGGRPSAWLKVEPRLEGLMDLYANGATMDQLAAHAGISPAALYRLKAQKEEFREAFRIGHFMQEDRLRGKLWEMAMGNAERVITETRLIAPGEDPKALYNKLHGGLPRAQWRPVTDKEKEQEIKRIEAAVKAIEEAGLTPSVKTVRVIRGGDQLKACILILKNKYGWDDKPTKARRATPNFIQANLLDGPALLLEFRRRLGLSPSEGQELNTAQPKSSIATGAIDI